MQDPPPGAKPFGVYQSGVDKPGSVRKPWKLLDLEEKSENMWAGLIWSQALGALPFRGPSN